MIADWPAFSQARLSPVCGRRLLVALERAVVARGLALLGVEVLDRLEVQQAVDRLLVGVGVALVHPRPDLHPPLGHPEGEPGVGRDGRGDDDEVPGVEHRPEDRRDQQELEQHRHDREQQVAQQHVDALDAAVDDPVEPAGPPPEVEAQPERVHVPEGLDRHLPQRPLSDAREDAVAQLGEGGAGEAQRPVGEGQRHRPGRQVPGGRSPARRRQPVDRRLEERRRRHRRELGEHQRHQRGRDPRDGCPASSSGQRNGAIRRTVRQPLAQAVSGSSAMVGCRYSDASIPGRSKIWPG